MVRCVDLTIDDSKLRRFNRLTGLLMGVLKSIKRREHAHKWVKADSRGIGMVVVMSISGMHRKSEFGNEESGWDSVDVITPVFWRQEVS